MKNVEGMPNFFGKLERNQFWNEGKKKMHFILKKGMFQLKRKNWREVSSDQFLKKTLFGLMKLQGQIAIFYKTPFPRFKELGKSVLTYLIIQYLFQY